MAKIRKERKKKEFPASPVIRTVFSLPRAQVQSLVRELRSHRPCALAKKKKKRLFSKLVQCRLLLKAFPGSLFSPQAALGPLSETFSLHLSVRSLPRLLQLPHQKRSCLRKGTRLCLLLHPPHILSVNRDNDPLGLPGGLS